MTAFFVLPFLITFLPGVAPAAFRQGHANFGISSHRRGRMPPHGSAPCDIAASAGTPCVVAYSLARPLFSSYTGPLFQVSRTSDRMKKNIGIVNRQADIKTLISFCANTACHFIVVYDQTKYHLNAINGVPAGHRMSEARPPVVRTVRLPGGRTVPYWGDGFLEAGTRAGLSSNGAMPTGQSPVTEYMVSGPHTGTAVCCYDFGEAETTWGDDGGGSMFALDGSFGDHVGIDMENGGAVAPTGGLSAPYSIFGKTDGNSSVTLKYARRGGGLTVPATTSPYCSGTITVYNAPLRCWGYGPMKLEGGLTLGIGGDSAGYAGPDDPSNHTRGAFIEGAVIAAQTTDATDNAIQRDINRFYR